jgi:hypothetical protein
MVVSLADRVPEGAVRLPMPNELLPSLDEKIQGQSGRVAVVGIDAYLSLLSDVDVTVFLVGLRGRIDDGRLTVAYLVSDRLNPHFDNPKYEGALNAIKVGGDFECAEPPKVEVVSDEGVKSGNPADYRALLKQRGDFLPEGNFTLVLKNLCYKQAGLGDNVSIVFDETSQSMKHSDGFPVWESPACKNGRKITVELEKDFDNGLLVKYGYAGSRRFDCISLEKAMAVHHAVAWFINSGTIKEQG